MIYYLNSNPFFSLNPTLVTYYITFILFDSALHLLPD